MSQDMLHQLYRAIGPMIPLFAIFAIFYVLMILPIRKKQRALQALLANLKKGDRVLTTGGLYGEVASLTDSTVVLRIADTIKVKVARSAISGLEGEAEKGGNA